MKKFWTRICVFFEGVRGFVVALLVSVLILVFVVGITHNVLKINELSSKYNGPYKNLVKIAETTMMNVYQVGDGSQTVVIMSGYGVQSPVLFYKSLANRLNQKGYRVIIVENLGYGFSTSAKTDRTNSQIARDLHDALVEHGNVGPYILMPHSISSLYAMKFTAMYPDEVSKVISIDGIVPGMIDEEGYKNDLHDERININITSILGLTGFERILSYVMPEMYYIDYMNADSNYNMDDIELYRREIAVNYLNRSMVKEINKLEDNINELKNYSYPSYVKVIQIVTNEMVNKYEDKVKDGSYNNDYLYYAEKLNRDTYVHKIVQVEGNHMIPITAPQTILEVIDE